ncbi:hypothetical protein UFOVP450_173 [uncultured Caudovirales phage]|uniref:Uncharacterized protein n=1 Tax=uncultured Caudovirales phage TaxID=2100421 RepID=A0A6J5MA83_9CAUD|nr:hypothetical protein UFOVP450_173 [uncultured Caudovirales phage]
MRITESQLRKTVRRQIAAILKEEEEQNPQMGMQAPEEQPQEEPEQEEVSKATKMAQKLVERIKQDSELTSAESVTDMVIVFMESMGFSNETKLQILRNVKTETVH